MGLPGIAGPPGETGIMGIPVSVIRFKWTFCSSAFCDYFLFNFACFFYFLFSDFLLQLEMTIFKLACLPFRCGSAFQGW